MTNTDVLFLLQLLRLKSNFTFLLLLLNAGGEANPGYNSHGTFYSFNYLFWRTIKSLPLVIVDDQRCQTDRNPSLGFSKQDISTTRLKNEQDWTKVWKSKISKISDSHKPCQLIVIVSSSQVVLLTSLKVNPSLVLVCALLDLLPLFVCLLSVSVWPSLFLPVELSCSWAAAGHFLFLVSQEVALIASGLLASCVCGVENRQLTNFDSIRIMLT